MKKNRISPNRKGNPSQRIRYPTITDEKPDKTNTIVSESTSLQIMNAQVRQTPRHGNKVNFTPLRSMILTFKQLSLILFDAVKRDIVDESRTFRC